MPQKGRGQGGNKRKNKNKSKKDGQTTQVQTENGEEISLEEQELLMKLIQQSRNLDDGAEGVPSPLMQKLYNMMGQIGLSNNVGTGKLLTEKMQSQDLDGAVDNGNASAEEQKADELQNDGNEDEEVKRAEPAGSQEQENNDDAEI